MLRRAQAKYWVGKDGLFCIASPPSLCRQASLAIATCSCALGSMGSGVVATGCSTPTHAAALMQIVPTYSLKTFSKPCYPTP